MKLDTGKSKIYEMTLYDGESDGVIRINQPDGIVVCYKLSKDYFHKYQDDTEIKNKKSVYVLYGKGKFYVGQAGIRKDDTAITSRIKEHLKDPDKDFVEEIVFFCHSSNKWTGGELGYLEASLISYFKEHGFPLYKEQNNETVDPYISSRELFIYQGYLTEIITLLEILGYDSIRKALSGDKEKIEKENIERINKDFEDKKYQTVSKALLEKKQLSSEIYNKFLTMKRGKAKICKKQLIDWGIEVDVSTLSFASYSKKGYYWMEPSKEVLSDDWMFVLFDAKNKIMDIFYIPNNTFTYVKGKKNSLVLRKDRQDFLKFEIEKEPYVDKQSKIDFSKYCIRKISFDVV